MNKPYYPWTVGESGPVPRKRDEGAIYESEPWVGNPKTLSGGYWSPTSQGKSAIQSIVDARLDIEVLGEWEDKEAEYEYTERAVIRIDEELFMLETSGCSCPSPQETWIVEAGPYATLQELREALGQNIDPGAEAALADAAETLANEREAR